MGTVLEHTKLPLTTWLLAWYLLTQSKYSSSALEPMRLREAPRRLDGRVEIDGAYRGGERSGSINGGRGATNKCDLRWYAAGSKSGQINPLRPFHKHKKLLI